MKNIIRFKRSAKSLVTSESLLAVLFVAGLFQIALCFEANVGLATLNTPPRAVAAAPQAAPQSMARVAHANTALTNIASPGFASPLTHG